MHLQFNRKEELAEQLSSSMGSFSINDNESTGWTMRAPGIEGAFKFSVVGPGMSHSRVQGAIEESFRFRSRSFDTPIIELGICLEGVFQHKIRGQGQEITAFPGQCSISFIEGELDVETTIPGTRDFHMLEIHFTPDTFDSFCSRTGSCLPKSLLSFRDGNFRGVKNCSCVMPSFLNGPLSEIIRNSEKGAAPDLIEENCLEYAAGLISFLNGGMQSGGTILSSRDIERVREARSILAENLEAPPNLIELSRHVGLNDYKLKTGFRQAYGKTMHQVLTELRLRKAERLLLSGKGTVAEAAYASGYRNPGDFSIAFKQRFGSSPRQYRRNISTGYPSPE